MIILKRLLFHVLLLTIFPLPSKAFAQTTTDTYEKLWKIIHSDTLSKENKLHYLEVYYRKAQLENNVLEEYRALKKNHI